MNEPTRIGKTIVIFPKQWEWTRIHLWCADHGWTIMWWKANKQGCVEAHGA